MSFFGFDPNVPPHQRNAAPSTESYDFQETYDGLGEQLDEADDALNEATFGVSGDIQKDFSFGATPNAAAAPPPPQTVSYAAAAAQPANDDEFMKDLWGDSSAKKDQAPAAPQEKKILSLEEIEAQLTAIDQSQQPPPQFAQQPYGMPGMMPHPQFGMMPPNGFMPPVYGQYPQQVPPQFMGAPAPFFNQFQQPQQFPPQVQQHHQVPHAPQQVPQTAQITQQGQQPPQVPQQIQQIQQAPQQVSPGQQPQQIQQQEVPPQPQQTGQVPLAEFLAPKLVESPAPLRENFNNNASRSERPTKVNLSQFPVLGSKEPHSSNSHQRYHRYEVEVEQQNLTPEQQAKLAKRHEKVSRIMRHTGIMNPKDKDFVTRFQLSQIVTEDPYNEDFYAQVFKVIHPKPNANPSQQQAEQNNSIAQAYLDQSGHRLGGRNKRADVALQRMQQQVQRAVTVAKERPKLTQFATEGALGKISFGTGKKPRQQLEIFSKAVQEQIEKQDAEASNNNEKSDTIKTVKKSRSPSMAAPSQPKKQYTKKDVMGILENVITELMTVESESRLASGINTNDLWDSLRVFEQTSSKVNDPSEVNPFIQCLNYEKALKILPRLFKFLSREQILTLVTLIMSNLSHLSVIKNGSYTTYPEKKIPTMITKLVETYSLTFSKVLMNSVQDFKFNEIIGLLVILIEHNNVSLVSTTKIGLSILTTLLSRAELIRGEGTISATDLSEWTSCYDELFTSLESHISLIFPPHENEIESINESYVWQFLATLALGGKLSHQRIIVDEVRDEIFWVMNKAKAIDSGNPSDLYKKQTLLNNLNTFLVVMGLVADENEIKELQT